MQGVILRRHPGQATVRRHGDEVVIRIEGRLPAADAIVAPSIKGVVGSSLYISSAVSNLYSLQRCRQFIFAAQLKAGN